MINFYSTYYYKCIQLFCLKIFFIYFRFALVLFFWISMMSSVKVLLKSFPQKSCWHFLFCDLWAKNAHNITRVFSTFSACKFYHSKHLYTGLVWYSNGPNMPGCWSDWISNGPNMPDCWMDQISNGHLNTLPDFQWSFEYWSSFLMAISILDHVTSTFQKADSFWSSIQMNWVFRCPNFGWLLYF